ncbi:response regulator transcription factor [Marinobacteraceae bacterium S3BR75-40.1]
MRLLLVEDDHPLAETMVDMLREQQMTVDWVDDGEQAQQAIRYNQFDAVILDLTLPGRDGLEVLRDIRRQGIATPVIILTARAELDERLQGLDAGADDYLSKPFSMAELLARIRAVTRRAGGHASTALDIGPLSLDTASHAVTLEGESLTLSRMEFQILHYLMSHMGQVATRSQLEDQLYGWNQGVESNALEVHIHNLRKKLGKSAIRTLRGVGYMLDASGLVVSE